MHTKIYRNEEAWVAPLRFSTPRLVSEHHQAVLDQIVGDIDAVSNEAEKYGVNAQDDANTASIAIAVALASASGQPHNPGWRRAVFALHTLRRRVSVAVPDCDPALARLAAFIDENSDLTPL